MAAMIATASLSWGPHGFGLSLYAALVFLLMLSRSDNKLLWPLNRFRPSFLECCILFAICAVLHGLSMPAVMSQHHKRQKAVAPPASIDTRGVFRLTGSELPCEKREVL